MLQRYCLHTTSTSFPCTSALGMLVVVPNISDEHRRSNDINDNVNALDIFINPYPTAFPYGNGMVPHFYQQQESSTTKTVHKVINKGLKTYV